MNYSDIELGVITTVLERLEKQRLPQALAIKEKVDRGDILEDFDIDFLKEIFADAQNNMPYVQNHPEYQQLAAQLAHLYHEITEKALENQADKEKH